MKSKSLLILLCVSLFCSSCSSGIEQELDSSDEVNWVKVNFDLRGDFLDVSNKPMSKVDDSKNKIYYYFRVCKSFNDETHYDNLGHYGFFDDLGKAQLTLEAGVSYNVYATALKECGTIINVDSLSTIRCSEHLSFDEGNVPVKDINIYNKFSENLISRFPEGPIVSGTMDSPLYTDQNIDRFFNTKSVNVNSDETIIIDLKRYSYAITAEIDAPRTGSVVLSCEKPKFTYKVSSKDPHLTTSKTYSLSESTDLSTSKKITINLESYNPDGSLLQSKQREITVKANVETVLRVKFDEPSGNNQFSVHLDTTPMVKHEIEL